MWFPLALFTAFASSLVMPINKRLAHKMHPVTMLFFCILFTLPCMAVALLMIGGVPHFTPAFIRFVFYASILDIVAFVASSWAFRHAPVSLLSPIGALTPVFATLFGFLFLREVPSLMQLIGILTIVCGAYLLNLSDVKMGIFMPIKKLISDKGVRLYLVQTIIFGITPVFQKQAIFETHPHSPLFVSFIGNAMVAIPLFFYVFRKLSQVKDDNHAVNKNVFWFFLFGVINAVTQLAAFTVFSLTNVGIATALFNLSMVFTILLGKFFFKEERIKERLLGALIMLLGTILIALKIS